MSTFGEEGVIEKTGPSLGIAFSDQLLHGWDLAKATGQDADDARRAPRTAAYKMIHGRFTEQQRRGIFKPEVAACSECLGPGTSCSHTRSRPVGLIPNCWSFSERRPGTRRGIQAASCAMTNRDARRIGAALSPIVWVPLLWLCRQPHDLRCGGVAFKPQVPPPTRQV